MTDDPTPAEDEELLSLLVNDPAAAAARAAADPEVSRRLERLRNELTGLRAAADSVLGNLLPGASRVGAVGRYTVVGERSGRGGPEKAYRALHPTEDVEVMLLVAATPVPPHAAERARLAAEGRLLAEVEHPNVARVFELSFDAEERPFLAQEFVTGPDLAEVATTLRPDPRQVAAWVAAVARGLAEAHRRGVVHGAVAARAIVLDERDRPRLIDLGLVRLRGGDIEPPTALADIRALGGVLKGLLAEPVPPPLAAVVQKALADGYPNADELAADLEAYAEGPRRTLRRAAWAAVAVGALLIAAALWLWLGR
jgi:Protein kinase domain